MPISSLNKKNWLFFNRNIRNLLRSEFPLPIGLNYSYYLVMNQICLLSLIFFLVACASQVEVSSVRSPYQVGINDKVGPIKLGGFSGLHFISKQGGKILLATVTDRGPNTKSYDFDKDGVKDRAFFLPNYSPEIILLEFQAGKVEVKKRLSLRHSIEKPVLGIPNQLHLDEMPFDTNSKRLKFQLSGVDPEGISMDPKGNFWIVEEYGPSILKVSPEGIILERFIPNSKVSIRRGTKVLPSFLSKRRLNRGFEGVAIIQNKLYAILQSPIPTKKAHNNGIGHLIEFDIESEKVTGHYLYPFSSKGKKIGALARTNQGELLVLEQNGKTGQRSFKKIFTLDLENATNLINNDHFQKDLEANFISKKYKAVKKNPYINLDHQLFSASEKLEGLAYVPSVGIIICKDNDFGVSDSLNLNTMKLKKSFKNHETSDFYFIPKSLLP